MSDKDSPGGALFMLLLGLAAAAVALYLIFLLATAVLAFLGFAGGVYGGYIALKNYYVSFQEHVYFETPERRMIPSEESDLNLKQEHEIKEEEARNGKTIG